MQSFNVDKTNMYNDYFKGILIVGFGNIGRHIYAEFEALSNEIDIRDIFIPEYCNSTNKTYKYAFICVPTDLKEDGSLDTSSVEDAINNVKADVIIIKSTLPVGTCEYLKNVCGKQIVYSPEFYGTTQHAPTSPNFVILGGDKKACTKVAELYYRVKPSTDFSIRYTGYREAEMVKLWENTALAMYVALNCDIYDACKQFGVQYPEVRDLVVMDERINKSHSFIRSEQVYWDSHCMNKDIPGLIACAGEETVPLITAMYHINQNRKVNQEK